MKLLDTNSFIKQVRAQKLALYRDRFVARLEQYEYDQVYTYSGLFEIQLRNSKTQWRFSYTRPSDVQKYGHVLEYHFITPRLLWKLLVSVIEHYYDLTDRVYRNKEQKVVSTYSLKKEHTLRCV